MKAPVWVAGIVGVVAAIAVVLLTRGGGDPVGLGGETATAHTAVAPSGTAPPRPLAPATGSGLSRTASGAHRPVTTSAVPVHPAAGRGRTVRAGQTVRGVARDANGQPLANAEVRVTVVTPTGPVLAVGRTGPDGAFAVAAPADGAATLEVRAPGLPPARRRVVPGESTTIDFTPPAQITGTVQGPDGRGVAGAFVRAEARTDSSLPPAVVQTGTDGRFVLNGLGRDAAYRLRATHPAFAAAEPLEITAPAVDATLYLREGAVLVVHVVGADGAPIQDAPKPQPLNQLAPWLALRAYAELRGPGAARTLSNWIDADPATIRFEGLSPGTYSVSAGVRGSGRGDATEVAVGSGGETNTTLQLSGGGWVVVRALDAKGNALPGAEAMPVAAIGTPWGYLVGALTGADGRARIGPFPTGEVALRVRPPNAPVVDVTAHVVEGTDVAVEARLPAKGE